MTEINLDHLLPFVRRPGRYCGKEINVVRKDWSEADLRVALAFPDLYEIGMSHQGLQILYQVLNSREKFLAERVYAPDIDLESLLRREKMPLFSLESKRSVADFDILAITLPYELCYTNILTIFDLAGIPFLSAERDQDQPLVIGGGPCACHSEPVADFFDLILLGDGEEAILEIAEIVNAARKQKKSKEETLLDLARVEGAYIPGFYKPFYDEKGDFQRIEYLKQKVGRVRRRVLSDLNNHQPSAPLVPLTGIVHDRLGLEVARGCTRGCRFCQAGITYRPVRERTPENIIKQAREGIAKSGFEELALLSLSSGDYSCLTPLLQELMNSFAAERVSVSLPSMRAGTLSPEIMEQIKKVRKTGFTIAPEAGTERLRQVINKGITEEDILETCKSAGSLGWKLIKFYFMFGLPTETWEDLEAIPALARKALAAAGKSGLRVTVSAGTFVPKPHTPFQWERQLSLEESMDCINYLKQSFPLGKGKNAKMQLRWADPRMSFLEGVMARGDRKLSGLVIRAWEKGARLDGWSDHFSLDLWQEAAREIGLEMEGYLGVRAFSEPLPWDHLDTGISRKYLEQEYTKAKRHDYTPDCRYHGCQQCGLCDFKKIRPVVGKKKTELAVESSVLSPVAEEMEKNSRYSYRFTYQRLGETRLISHLEMMKVFFRAFRRIKLPVAFSQGFNPGPKVSFSPALPLGTESMVEFFNAELEDKLNEPEDWRLILNNQLPDGLQVTDIAPLPNKKMPSKLIVTYLIDLADKEVEARLLADVMEKENYYIKVIRKKREKMIDAREQIIDLRLGEDGKITLVLSSESGKAGLKPMEIISDILGLTEVEEHKVGVLKTDIASENLMTETTRVNKSPSNIGQEIYGH